MSCQRTTLVPFHPSVRFERPQKLHALTFLLPKLSDCITFLLFIWWGSLPGGPLELPEGIFQLEPELPLSPGSLFDYFLAFLLESSRMNPAQSQNNTQGWNQPGVVFPWGSRRDHIDPGCFPDGSGPQSLENCDLLGRNQQVHGWQGDPMPNGNSWHSLSPSTGSHLSYSGSLAEHEKPPSVYTYWLSSDGSQNTILNNQVEQKPSNSHRAYLTPESENHSHTKGENAIYAMNQFPDTQLETVQEEPALWSQSHAGQSQEPPETIEGALYTSGSLDKGVPPTLSHSTMGIGTWQEDNIYQAGPASSTNLISPSASPLANTGQYFTVPIPMVPRKKRISMDASVQRSNDLSLSTASQGIPRTVRSSRPQKRTSKARPTQKKRKRIMTEEGNRHANALKKGGGACLVCRQKKVKVSLPIRFVSMDRV